jgi:thioredoxin-dependent peroxiredoxin
MNLLLQACAFRDSYEKFKKAGAEVVGISGDDSSSHKVKLGIFTA